jgi:hypothetical protein
MNMKKYNCFEELKEQFGGENEFECEGEKFELEKCLSFRVDTPLHSTLIKNIGYGIKVCIYMHYRCVEYYYRSI